MAKIPYLIQNFFDQKVLAKGPCPKRHIVLPVGHNKTDSGQKVLHLILIFDVRSDSQRDCFNTFETRPTAHPPTPHPPSVKLQIERFLANIYQTISQSEMLLQYFA